MRSCHLLNLCLVSLVGLGIPAQVCGQSSPDSNSAKHSTAGRAPKNGASDSGIEAGEVLNGVYRNRSLGLAYKIPEGWVLRTDDMNASAASSDSKSKASSEGSHERKESEASGGKVLLAAFLRPPQAHGEDVNSSIVIAAESTSAYPGLKEASQYFGPLTEVVTAQGFSVDEEPYEIAIGTKTLVRGDFHKDVGSRVMRQSTLVFLSHGYAVSITVIGGTEDEVEDLIDRLTIAER